MIRRFLIKWHEVLDQMIRPTWSFALTAARLASRERTSASAAAFSAVSVFTSSMLACGQGGVSDTIWLEIYCII